MKKADFQPGFKISEKQYFTFWRMWRQALEAQGWDGLTKAEQDAKRYEMLGRAGFSSLKAVDHTNGFDRVKRELLALQDVLVESAEAGQRRRYLHRIGEQIPELERLDYGPALNKILVERFKVVAGVSTIEDLRTNELLHLVETLDRCFKDQREAAREDHDAGKAAEIDEDEAAGLVLAGGVEEGGMPF
jgi:hypothetical protein